jgi:hypothetical protein
MPPAKSRHGLLTTIHAEGLCNFLPPEAADDEIKDECGTIGPHPSDCCPQLIQTVLALELCLVIEGINN